MQSDLPHTLYNYDPKGKAEGNQTFSQADIDEAIRMNEESLKRSRERRRIRQQEQGYTVDELLKGEADK